MQSIKEIFITFIALYTLLVSSGLLTTIDYLHVDKNYSKIPSCDLKDAGNSTACTCSCKMKSAQECHCCSAKNRKMNTAGAGEIIICGCMCGDFPGHKATFVALKFIVEFEPKIKLYSRPKRYIQIQSHMDQNFVSSIDHPPPIFLS